MSGTIQKLVVSQKSVIEKQCIGHWAFISVLKERHTPGLMIAAHLQKENRQRLSTLRQRFVLMIQMNTFSLVKRYLSLGRASFSTLIGVLKSHTAKVRKRLTTSLETRPSLLCTIRKLLIQTITMSPRFKAMFWQSTSILKSLNQKHW